MPSKAFVYLCRKARKANGLNVKPRTPPPISGSLYIHITGSRIYMDAGNARDWLTIMRYASVDEPKLDRYYLVYLSRKRRRRFEIRALDYIMEEIKA